MDEKERLALIEKYDVRPQVLTFDEIKKMAPKLEGHEKLVNRLLKFFKVDEVNRVHSRWSDTPGPEFVKHLVEDDFKVKLRVDNEEVLSQFPTGAFVTVSNHPFGALDGITLIYLVTRYRPEFRVMVNMFLNHLSAMRPNFIAVNAWGSKDPKQKMESFHGVRDAIRQLKQGEPVGFFPAGAMSKTNWKGQLVDREWQKTVIQIIQKAKVPVVPIYFHGNNSFFFNFLGHACWPARSAFLPRELFKRRGKEMHISVGDPITPEMQAQYPTIEELGAFLREKTYALRDIK